MKKLLDKLARLINILMGMETGLQYKKVEEKKDANNG